MMTAQNVIGSLKMYNYIYLCYHLCYWGVFSHLNGTTFTKNIKFQRPICQSCPPWLDRVDRTSADDHVAHNVIGSVKMYNYIYLCYLCYFGGAGVLPSCGESVNYYNFINILI